MIDLRGIETFYWVATLGGFRAAAEQLHASQPAISQRIQQLEEALGVRLFDRDTRGVRLTVRGQLLLVQAEQMLQLRQDMLRLARAQDVVVGRLTLGVAETIVQTWLPTLLARVREVFPDLMLDIEVHTSPVLRTKLLSHQLDLAFLMGPVLEAQVENLPLCQYPLAWVAHAELELGPEPVPLARIAQQPVITYAASSHPYQALRGMLMGAVAATPQMYGSASLNTVARLALNRLGVAVVAPVVLARELASGQLRIVQVQSDPLPDLVFTSSWMRGRDSQVPAAIARLASKVAKEESA
ncbi:LysR family transcriptional regulator [Vandammella animalimorsus]|uniref:LysR family transcriptional regulator n=1 Tax=Vandammella animalimorsus TaxID=2029117 RepID=UPI00325ACA55